MYRPEPTQSLRADLSSMIVSKVKIPEARARTQSLSIELERVFSVTPPPPTMNNCSTIIHDSPVPTTVRNRLRSRTLSIDTNSSDDIDYETQV